MKYKFNVEVDCETIDEAHQVMAERLDPDEDYGFKYRVDWFQDPSNFGIPKIPTEGYA